MKRKFVNYILLALLALVAIYWAYKMFQREDEVPTISISASGFEMAGESLTSAEQLIQVLQNMSNVTLAERSLLGNRIFQSQLQDFGRPLIERPWGRNNPFASPGLGGAPAPLATSTSTSR